MATEVFDGEQAGGFEDGEGYVTVNNEQELRDWATASGWASIEEFEAEHRVQRTEVYGRPFMTCKGSLSFKN